MFKHVKLLLGVLIAVSFAVEAALAGDSASIGVSCSIPAVPGLNAPAIQTAQENPDTAEGEEITPVYEQSGQEQPLIIEEEGEVQLAYNKTDASVIMQTIYVR